MGLGGIFKGAANIITGGMSGLGGKIVETIAGQFPDRMSEAEKAQAVAAANQVANEHALDMLTAWNAQEATFNERLRDMEGTASDLKAIPIIGPIVIFLRGLQRPF